MFWKQNLLFTERMATIRLLFRSTANNLLTKRCQPIVRSSAVTLWSSSWSASARKVPQLLSHRLAAIEGLPLVLRPMSYVSNIKRFSGRYRSTGRLLAFGIAIGSVVLMFQTVSEYVSKRIRSRRLLSSAAKLLVAEDVPQISPSRIVSNYWDIRKNIQLLCYSQIN